MPHLYSLPQRIGMLPVDKYGPALFLRILQGLDPAVVRRHARMDCRIKSGNDDYWELCGRCTSPPHSRSMRPCRNSRRPCAAQHRRAGSTAGRRQDHARAARAGAGRLGTRTRGKGAAHPGVGTAAAGGARRRRAHGQNAGREGRRDGRAAGALRLESIGTHPHRGDHRRHLHSACPRRPHAGRRRRRVVRRIP